MDAEDFCLDSYDYQLPPGQIASHPAARRGESRLMIGPGLASRPYSVKTSFFNRIAEFLPKKSLLVLNNTRVLPARLHGRRSSGGKAELLLLTPLSLLNGAEREDGWSMARAEALIKPAAKFAVGGWFSTSAMLKARIVEKESFGRVTAELFWKGNLEDIFNEIGQIPLPPYIRRPPDELDKNSYQTVYAKNTGAVAAPTAGLHFTRQIMADLQERGFQLTELTLHVGYGTFTPVRYQDIRRHKMHAEYLEIPEKTAQLLEKAKREGRPVIAVGTTSLRAMEGMYEALGKIDSFSGWTNIFIYPGKPVHLADGLITNFHLPCSSLLMLAAALTGRERLLQAYREAVDLGFRFFSYGDAMLIV